MHIKMFFFIIFALHIVVGTNGPVGVVRIIHNGGDPAHGTGTLVQIDGFPELTGRLVLTARHVIDDAEDVQFTFQEKTYRGDKWWYHPYPVKDSGLCTNAADIAIIFLRDRCDAPPVLFTYNPEFEIGEIVQSIACPSDLMRPRLAEFQVCGIAPGIIDLKYISGDSFFHGDSGAPLIRDAAGYKVILGVFIATLTDKESEVDSPFLASFGETFDRWREPGKDDAPKNILEVLSSYNKVSSMLSSS